MKQRAGRGRLEHWEHYAIDFAFQRFLETHWIFTPHHPTSPYPPTRRPQTCTRFCRDAAGDVGTLQLSGSQRGAHVAGVEAEWRGASDRLLAGFSVRLACMPHVGRSHKGLLQQDARTREHAATLLSCPVSRQA